MTAPLLELAASCEFDRLAEQLDGQTLEFRLQHTLHILDAIPEVVSPEKYKRLLPDPVLHQQWYVDRAMAMERATASPANSIELLRIALSLCSNLWIKRILSKPLERLELYEVFLSVLASLQLACGNDSEVSLASCSSHTERLVSEICCTVDFRAFERFCATGNVVAVLAGKHAVDASAEQWLARHLLTCRAKWPAAVIGTLVAILKSAADGPLHSPSLSARAAEYESTPEQQDLLQKLTGEEMAGLDELQCVLDALPRHVQSAVAAAMRNEASMEDVFVLGGLKLASLGRLSRYA